ncbi:hypothetical protein PROPHIGD17-1_38 [Mycobacterium phage prophiGD17-1]|nr:hypothetical protein PHIGD17-1_77 [Mycobacterium phage phiGD17-1]QSM02736.1 hypothetical protein PROPHIGD17-1_38 [Mycobacterium phage prophiGD17-1]SHX05918.1 Uncharacterised protein [Mycobacteroides abscessus subsp. abscessus]
MTPAKGVSGVSADSRCQQLATDTADTKDALINVSTWSYI